MSFSIDKLEGFLSEDDGVVEGGFELNPIADDEGGYVVEKGGVPACTVDFVDENDASEDFEIVQDNPEKYLVHISLISDKALTDEYVEKLKLMGFKNIQM